MHPVNEVYERYRTDPTGPNEGALFDATRAYARSIGTLLLSGLHGTRYFHACENAATRVVMNVEYYNPQKASFSTWAYQCICRDLIDWARKLDRRVALEARFAAERHPVSIAREEEDWLLQDIMAALSGDDRGLIQLKIEGQSLLEMATQLGVSTATVKRRWSALMVKIRSKSGAKRKL